MAGVVQQLRNERDRAARTVEQLDAALPALDGAYGRSGRRGRLSAVARARIAAAQKARWAMGVRRTSTPMFLPEMSPIQLRFELEILPIILPIALNS